MYGVGTRLIASDDVGYVVEEVSQVTMTWPVAAWSRCRDFSTFGVYPKTPCNLTLSVLYHTNMSHAIGLCIVKQDKDMVHCHGLGKL